MIIADKKYDWEIFARKAFPRVVDPRTKNLSNLGSKLHSKIHCSQILQKGFAPTLSYGEVPFFTRCQSANWFALDCQVMFHCGNTKQKFVHRDRKDCNNDHQQKWSFTQIVFHFLMDYARENKIISDMTLTIKLINQPGQWKGQKAFYYVWP